MPSDLEALLDDIGHFHQGRAGFLHPRTWDDGVMPLWGFPESHLYRILDAAHGSRRPAKYISGDGFQMNSRAWHEWEWTRGRNLRPDATYETRHRRKIPTDTRDFVYARDGHACLHCGATDRLSLDHIYPHSRGGSDAPDNLQTLCRPCNSRKGSRV